MTCEANCEVYSPRWGHTDTYRFAFETTGLEISHGARKRVATYSETMGLEWQGRESLSDIMRNDHVYAPYAVEDLIGHVWTAWKDGELNDEGVQRELDAFIAYINASTQAIPRTEFWNKIF